MRRRHFIGGAIGLGLGGGYVAYRGLWVPPSAAPPLASPPTYPLPVEEPLQTPAPAPTPEPPVPSEAPFRGATDVTFILISDLHFGAVIDGQPLEPVIETAISQINEMEGKPYPAALGGRVTGVRGVLAAGDLTEDGRPNEWQRFVETMGLRGGEGALNLPIYESLGNHDGHVGRFVRAGIESRHGAIHYAWSWDSLRFYCLSDGPDDEILAWLAADLAKVDAARGIVVYQHFPLGGAFSRGHWFGDGDYAERLAKTLEGRRVHGIFHGHFHATGHYLWRGHDVYVAGSPKHSWRSFLVVRITDERMTVAAWHYERRSWWWWQNKRLDRGRPLASTRYFPEGSFVRS